MSFVSNALGGLMGILSGADYNSNKVGDFYNQALGKLLDSTGSPAAQQFGAEEMASLQPMFNKQNQALAAKEAAMGITNSGAAKADFGDLGAQQSATLAGAVAPLYQSAIGQYGNIVGAEPGAQANAYQTALNNFQQAIETAATGGPTGGGGSQGMIAVQPQDSPFYNNPGAIPGGSGSGIYDVYSPYDPNNPDYSPYTGVGPQP